MYPDVFILGCGLLMWHIFSLSLYLKVLQAVMWNENCVSVL